MSFSTYEELVSSNEFKEKLSSLNNCLRQSLIDANEEPILIGNLFYAHQEQDFHVKPLIRRFQAKRRNFFRLADVSAHIVEVGVNGGHSALLALMSNPQLQYTGIDIASRLGSDWPRSDIYVPAAFTWLSENFGSRVEFFTGDSMDVLPQLAAQPRDIKCDFLHLDAAKDTHYHEARRARPIMKDGGLIVLDDMHKMAVRKGDRLLRQFKVVEPLDYEELGLEETEFHVIRRFVSR